MTGCPVSVDRLDRDGERLNAVMYALSQGASAASPVRRYMREVSRKTENAAQLARMGAVTVR